MEIDPPKKVTKAASPLILVATGIFSLLLFGVAGWFLRGLRDKDLRVPPTQPVAKAEPKPHARGRLVYQIHCARCHGPDGHGDGSESATLRPPPRDLTLAPWKTATNLDSIRRTVTKGLPGTMMVGLEAALSSTEIDAVVDYVASIAPRPPANAGISERIRAAGLSPITTVRNAPAISVRGVGDETIDLEGLRGKVALVVFWGTGCAPCVEELPHIEEFTHKHQSIVVVPICVDESDLTIARRVASIHTKDLKVFVDPGGTSKLSYDIQALPAAALISQDGLLLGESRGKIGWESPEMEDLIRALLSNDTPPGS